MSLYNYDRSAAVENDDPPRTVDEGIIFESDLASMTPGERARWKGYTARLIHSIFNKEEFEDIGDTANRKIENIGPFMSLEALVKHLGAYKWSEWIDPDQGLIVGKPKKDRKGGAAITDVYIECGNSPRLNREEREFLTDRLKLSR